jgi:aspartokinase
MLVAYGFLRKLFEVFDRHRTAVDMVATSEVSVSLTLDNVQSLAAIVAERDADRAVRKLHQDSFSECDPAVFEPPHT